MVDLDDMIYAWNMASGNYNAWTVISIFLIRKKGFFIFSLSFFRFSFYCNQTLIHGFIVLSNGLAAA